MVGPILIIKLDDASADDAIAACGGQVAGRWQASSASSGVLGSRERVCVVVRASGRQRGSAVRGSVRVRERVVVSASGQTAEAVCKSRDEIRLG